MDKKLQIRNSTVEFLIFTSQNGKDYNTKFYNLDLIISVGYKGGLV